MSEDEEMVSSPDDILESLMLGWRGGGVELVNTKPAPTRGRRAKRERSGSDAGGEEVEAVYCELEEG